MENIIVSGCLLGERCKYSGEIMKNLPEKLLEFCKDYKVISVCPEVLGGLEIPRPPSEIQNDKIINVEGKDVTKEFFLGADKTLEIAEENKACLAILKERSPSCGSTCIYDGTFKGKLIKGMGVTARLLTNNGIKVLSEEDFI